MAETNPLDVLKISTEAMGIAYLNLVSAQTLAKALKMKYRDPDVLEFLLQYCTEVQIGIYRCGDAQGGGCGCGPKIVED